MSMKKSTFDAVIVGGGAAGLFAAVQASARGRRVLLLEKNSRCGKKLLITGKGRCNVTNACTAEEALKNIPRNGRFLYSAMAAFPPEAAMAFFEQGGCPLKIERGNRVFPVSDRSADVLNVLERALQRGGVERRQTTVTGLSIADGAINGLSKIDADHIFFFSDDGTVGDTANLPTWQNLKAVKNGNVYCGLNEMQYDLAFTPNGKLMYMEQMVNAIINHENIDK